MQGGGDGPAIPDQYWRVGANFLELDTSAYFTHSPTSFADTGSNLPTGLSLNTSTGVISGTPTEVGTHAITITGTAGATDKTKTFTIYVRNWWEDVTAATDIASNGYHPGDVNVTGSDIDQFNDVIGSLDLAYDASAAATTPQEATLSGSDANFLDGIPAGDSGYINTGWTSSLGGGNAGGMCWGVGFTSSANGIAIPAQIGEDGNFNQSTFRPDYDDPNNEIDFRTFNGSATQLSHTGISNDPSGDLFGYMFTDGDALYCGHNGRLKIYDSSSGRDTHQAGTFDDAAISIGRAIHTQGGTRTGIGGAFKGAAFFNNADSPTVQNVARNIGGLAGERSSGLTHRPTVLCYSMGNSIKGGWSPAAANMVSIASSRGFSLISTTTAATYAESGIYDVIDHDILNLTNNTTNLLGDLPGGKAHYTGRASATIYMLHRLSELSSSLHFVHAEVTENGSCWHPDTADNITKDYWFSDSDVTNSSSQRALYDLALPEFQQCDQIVYATAEIDQDHIFRMVYIGGLTVQDARHGQITIGEFETQLRAFLTRVNSDLSPDLIVLDQCSVDRSYSPDYSLFESWHDVEVSVAAEFSNVSIGCPTFLQEGTALTVNADNEWTAGADYVSTDDVHMEAAHHRAQGRWDATNIVWPAIKAKWQ